MVTSTTRHYGTTPSITSPPPPYDEEPVRAPLPPLPPWPPPRALFVGLLAVSMVGVLAYLSVTTISRAFPPAGCPTITSTAGCPTITSTIGGPTITSTVGGPTITSTARCPAITPTPTPEVPPPEIPWPGKTYIIQDRKSGNVITLMEGSISLEAPTSKGVEVGGQQWECIMKEGWLGFKNPVSGRFLGHDSRGYLQADAVEQHSWEEFCVRQHPEGGYVLFLRHYDGLEHIGLSWGRLAKVGDSSSELLWDFVKPKV
ncbi:hypothetical protein ABW19_dt0205833 [Dactylella cylindrospora]|nr:hypothetical protein ABW19_dt0205833 [Dactylella cylindrospora]